MTATHKIADRLGITPLAVTGLITLTVVFGGSLLVVSGLHRKLLAKDGETVKAVFSETAQLRKGSHVRVRGVEAGRVKNITVEHGGRSATVEMEVFDEGLPVYADAKAAIRYKSVLGGALIVDLDRGTASKGELGPRTIPQERTESQVEVDQIISIFRGETRDGLRTMLAEFPQALSDPAAPASALRALARASGSLREGIGALRGQRRGDLRRLVSRTAGTVRALDDPLAVRDLVEGAAVTLETTARRQADLRGTFTRLAHVQPAVVATLGRLDTTLGIADPVIARLREPATQVAPTAARLRPTLVRTNALLGDATPLLRSLRPAASSLAAAARSGLPLLRGLEPGLKRIDGKILPGLAKRSPVTKLATYEMIGPALAGLGPAIAGHFDGRGHYVRFPASGSERSIGGYPCRTYFTDPEQPGNLPDAQGPGALVMCESLQQALREIFPPGGAPKSRGGRR